MTFAELIRRQREYLGLTMQECADAMGIKRQAWNRWEQGVLPATKTLPNICELLEITPDACIDAIKQTNKLHI